jgi:hypothetical protein
MPEKNVDKSKYCQHAAGVLKNDKLSKKAKDKFIKEVKEELLLGTDGVATPPLPCGAKFPPVPFADRLDLEDEKKFPKFHEHILGTYEDIAKALDVMGQFTFLPVLFDPIALAIKLELKPPKISFPKGFSLYGLSFPLFAVKMGFKPPKLALKLPELGKIPPDIPLPKYDIKIPDFQALFDFKLWPLKMPELVVNLMVEMPNLFLKILQFDLSAFCDATQKAGLFRSSDLNPAEAVVWAVAYKVLLRKTAECVSIMVIGTTIGCAPGGVVGAVGKKYGYDPMPPDDEDDEPIRNKIVKAAVEADGYSWSKDNENLKSVGGAFNKADLDYTTFMLPHEVDTGDINKLKKAFLSAQGYSGCGLFARAVFMRGGATDDHFTKPYKNSTAISGIVAAAIKKNALIKFGKKMPALKKGDAILIGNEQNDEIAHMLIIKQDYDGGNDGTIYVMEGGGSDPGNPLHKGTSIGAGKYTFLITDGGYGHLAVSSPSGYVRQVVRIFDGEKLVKDPEEQNT